MNVYINQCININQMKLGSITNSSVLQIGTAGSIRAVSYLYNSGGYIGPAPQPEPQRHFVPLPPPSEINWL